MTRGNRQRLLEMVRGESGSRVPLWRINFGGGPPRDPEFIDGDEVDKLFDAPPSENEGVVYHLLFGCPDGEEAQILRENPCLVRQPDGSFKAHNVGKGGPVYIVE